MTCCGCGQAGGRAGRESAAPGSKTSWPVDTQFAGKRDGDFHIRLHLLQSALSITETGAFCGRL